MNLKKKGMVGLMSNVVNEMLLQVSENKVLAAPFEVFHDAQDEVLHRVVIAPNSVATLVEYFGAEKGALTQRLQIVLQKGARLRHVRVQHSGLKHVHASAVHVEVEADAQYRAFQFDLGAKRAKTVLKIDLLDEGAQADLSGLYVLDDEQVVENNVLVSHHVSKGKSRQAYKGIFQGASEGGFTGKVFVHKNAQHTEAEQANHNILLSKKAKVTFKPELEIYADDVNCSHGATVGQLDEQSIFYLQSRGIDRFTGKRMLLNGFAAEILDEIDERAVYEKVKPFIDKRIASVL